MTNQEYGKIHKTDYYAINVLLAVFDSVNRFLHIFGIFIVESGFLQLEVDYTNSSNLIKLIPQPPMMIIDKKNLVVQV